ncbi:MAG TPA: hypothetical protein VHS59_09560 [Bacillota bacterium]|nr:hypothetical protein [Bacillota bacterium]
MELNSKVKALEMFYVAALADSVKWYTREGILERVTAAKREEQLQQGKQQASILGITSPEQVFTTLADIFNCAHWEISQEDWGLVAEAKSCRLCAVAKGLNAGSPCALFCLNPMEAMVKGIRETSQFAVKETLWKGSKCRIEILS